MNCISPLKPSILPATITILLVASLASSVHASSQSVLSNESAPLKLIVTLSEGTPRTTGTITLFVTVENENGVIAEALVKALLTFSNARQRSLSGITDSNGTLELNFRIPTGTPEGPARIDIMVRIGKDMAIQSLSFTVE